MGLALQPCSGSGLGSHMLPWLILMMAVIISNFQPCRSQCFINRHLATKPAQEKVYRTDSLDLKEMFISILDFTAIIKEELPAKHGNLSITQPGDTGCPMLGEGYSLQFLTTHGKALISSIPILTDIIKLSNNRFIVPNDNVGVHLNLTQFEKLLEHLHIQLHLVTGAPPQLFLHMDSKEQLHLESFSIQKSNTCYLGPVSENIRHSLQNTLQLLQDVFLDVETVLHFFGHNHLYGKLGSCLQIKNITLQALMSIDNEKFDFCVESMANDTAPRLTKRSSLISWLVGSGAQLDSVEHTLMDSINHFNGNFAKISVFDSQVVESFDRLEKDINSLAQIEETLQEQIGDMQVFMRLQNIKFQYLFSRLQHENAIHRLLKESKMVENLALLTRSLFGANECHLRVCETSISPESYQQGIVKVHREMVQLEPTEVALVSCLATSSGAVSTLHNQMADITLQSKFLIDGKLFTKETLQNASAVNVELYPLPQTDILLQLFHHYSNESRIFLQCLKVGDYTINGEKNLCSPLKHFPLEENFVIEANNEVLRSQMLVQRSNAIKTSWMASFTFSNIDKTELPPVPQFTFLHPSLESIILTPAGKLHVQNISYMVSTVTLVTILVLACCCFKNNAFRTWSMAKLTSLKNSLYEKFTSEEFRLKQEHKSLNKKVNQNWLDIERMESLINKKAALLSKLPAETSKASPSAPNPPLDTPDSAPIEVHTEHLRSHSNAPGPSSGRK